MIVIICAIFAPVIAPNSPDQIDPSLKYLKADWDYPLGTDQLGRCELSRLIYGARYAIRMSIPMADCRQTWCWVLCPAPFFF